MNRQASAVVWGVGYIGFTTMMHLADCGIDCVGYDPDAAKVAMVNAGRHPVPGLDGWLAIELAPLVAEGRVRATDRVEDVLHPQALVHMIAVPTERDGRPWWAPLRDVLSRFVGSIAGAGPASAHPPLLIVESTLAPGTVDGIVRPILAGSGVEVGRDLLLGIAPRRDWFVSPDKNLRTLDRVYCGLDARSADATQEVLSILCSKLHRASSYRVGEMVKCTENAYRHVEITLANQLCLGYPDVDIAEVLALAGTKWNMGSFRPSFGTGGYCIPLAGQYVLQGASHPELLSLLTAAYDSDITMRWRVARALLDRGCRRIGVLGLSYKGELKVAVMSPTVLIVKHLVDGGAEVRLNDPFYTDQEIADLTGAASFDLPADLRTFDALLVCTDHQRFLADDVRAMVIEMAGKVLIVDNFGLWRDWDWPAGAHYYHAGSRGWLQAQPS